MKNITYNGLEGGTYMTFGNRLSQLREEQGFHTRKSFAEKIGIPETTLRNYETDIREPGHTFLKQMSDFFKVSTDYLLGITEEKERRSTHQLKSSEFEHIEKYRSLDPHGKDMVDTVLDKEYDRCKTVEKNSIVPMVKKSIPDYLEPNAAHRRTDLDESEFTPELLKSDNDIMDDENF